MPYLQPEITDILCCAGSSQPSAQQSQQDMHLEYGAQASAPKQDAAPGGFHQSGETDMAAEAMAAALNMQPDAGGALGLPAQMDHLHQVTLTSSALHSPAPCLPLLQISLPKHGGPEEQPCPFLDLAVSSGCDAADKPLEYSLSFVARPTMSFGEV
jgi:hypothetical protein